MNLRKQECEGEWCPIFSNLQRPSKECIGRYDAIMVIPLRPELFPHMMAVCTKAEKSGERLRKFISP